MRKAPCKLKRATVSARMFKQGKKSEPSDYGYRTIDQMSVDGRLVLTGTRTLAADRRRWLKLSVFANFEKKVA